MIPYIAALAEGVQGFASEPLAGVRDRRFAGLAVAIVLLTLSGYMAAGGVTVDLSLERGQEAAAAGPPADDRPQGVVTGPTDGNRTDSDGDGLTDRSERRIYGTNPDVADTDGDGIPDGMEIACSEAFPDADPLRQDVYVELDSVEGASLQAASVDRLRRTFAAATVENPGNESGIALHVVQSDDDLPQGESVNDDPRAGSYNDGADYRGEHFQHRAAGYYYLLVATDVAYGGQEYYAGAGEPGTALVESYDRDAVMSSLVLHELGHAFGIGADADGVDERAYSREEYTSVMNYNALYDVTTYADGDGDVERDEWGFVAEDRYRPSIRTDGNLCPSVA